MTRAPRPAHTLSTAPRECYNRAGPKGGRRSGEDRGEAGQGKAGQRARNAAIYPMRNVTRNHTYTHRRSRGLRKGLIRVSPRS